MPVAGFVTGKVYSTPDSSLPRTGHFLWEVGLCLPERSLFGLGSFLQIGFITVRKTKSMDSQPPSSPRLHAGWEFTVLLTRK